MKCHWISISNFLSYLFQSLCFRDAWLASFTWKMLAKDRVFLFVKVNFKGI